MGLWSILRSMQKLGLSLLFALLGYLLTLFISTQNPGRRADLFYYDQSLQWRHQQGRSPRLDPRLVILSIDERSRQEIPDPIALWLPRYGEFIEAVFASQALVMGIDIIPTYAPPDHLLAFAQPALSRLPQIVMVCYYDQDTEQVIKPAAAIRAVLGDDRLALSNMQADVDKIFRRQTLTNLNIKGETIPFFASALFQSLKPESTHPPDLLINFVGPPGTIPQISVADLSHWIEQGDGPSMQAAFEGKIVLFGGTAKADQDFVDSPFPGSMAGIEQHANILNTMLSENYLQEKDASLLLFLLLLPVAWCAIRLPLRFSLPVSGLLAIAWLGGVYLALLANLVLTPSLTFLPGLLATTAAGYLYRFNTVEKERRRIRAVFGRYVSKDVMEAMLQVPENHRPESAVRQRVTVMFSDINDFSTACEQLEPEEVTRRLNLYFSEMTHIIYEHQGTIIRFIGDEFMVLFGAPTSHEKSEEMAVLAGVKMVDRLEQLRATDPQEQNGFYHVKIGIHVGDMILTSIGNELRSDYNCIGDSTNMAARVLSLTKPLDATVLISEEVKKKVDHRSDLSFIDKGVHPVKGRAGEVRVYDVESARPK